MRPRLRLARLARSTSPPAKWMRMVLPCSDESSSRLCHSVRAVATLTAIVGILFLAVALVMRVVGVQGVWGAGVIGAGAILGLAGGIMLASSGLRDGSPGAVDNASGIIAALVAAEKLGWREEVGIVITGAEELAMAGAREWVKRGRSGNVFFNFDGLDSRGKYVVWTHGGTVPGAARSIASALREELSETEKGLLRVLKLGLFVDGMVLGSAGAAGVTVQRGNLRTLLVAHRPSDTKERMDLSGAVEAGEAAALVIGRMLQSKWLSGEPLSS